MVELGSFDEGKEGGGEVKVEVFGSKDTIRRVSRGGREVLGWNSTDQSNF